METAKDILEKHGVRIFGAHQDRIIEAIWEIAEMTYDRFSPRIQEDCNCELCEMRRRKKSTFMKSLFPETKIFLLLLPSIADLRLWWDRHRFLRLL